MIGEKKRSESLQSPLMLFSLGSKKGISAIVATVLIILIVVAAVSLVWVAIIPLISDATSSYTSEEVELKVISDQGYTYYDPVDEYGVVHVWRGEDNYMGDEFLITYYLEDGNSITFTKTLPAENSAKVFYMSLGGYAAPVSVSVYFPEGSVASSGSSDIRVGDYIWGGNDNHTDATGRGIFLHNLYIDYADLTLENTDPCGGADFNYDGIVGLADLSKLASNYGFTNVTSHSKGDANLDGTVGLADLGKLATNYGKTGCVDRYSDDPVKDYYLFVTPELSQVGLNDSEQFVSKITLFDSQEREVESCEAIGTYIVNKTSHPDYVPGYNFSLENNFIDTSCIFSFNNPINDYSVQIELYLFDLFNESSEPYLIYRSELYDVDSELVGGDDTNDLLNQFEFSFVEQDLYNSSNSDGSIGIEDEKVLRIRSLDGNTDSITVNGRETDTIYLRWAPNGSQIVDRQSGDESLEIYYRDHDGGNTPRGKARFIDYKVGGALGAGPWKVADLELNDVRVSLMAQLADNRILLTLGETLWAEDFEISVSGDKEFYRVDSSLEYFGTRGSGEFDAWPREIYMGSEDVSWNNEDAVTSTMKIINPKDNLDEDLIILELGNFDVPTPTNGSGGGCFDSDGGLNYEVKGYIFKTYDSNSLNETLEDYCVSSSVLFEYHCLGENVGFNSTKDYVCPNGCFEGACNGQLINRFEFSFVEQDLYNSSNTAEYVFGDEKVLRIRNLARNRSSIIVGQGTTTDTVYFRWAPEGSQMMGGSGQEDSLEIYYIDHDGDYSPQNRVRFIDSRNKDFITGGSWRPIDFRSGGFWATADVEIKGNELSLYLVPNFEILISGDLPLNYSNSSLEYFGSVGSGELYASPGEILMNGQDISFIDGDATTSTMKIFDVENNLNEDLIILEIGNFSSQL